MPEEKVILTKQCKSCNTEFYITSKDKEFYDKISPTFNGEKYNIPFPNLCPKCRNQRRLAFRNEKRLYKRNCDFSGEEIISMYKPTYKGKVIKTEIWWSNKFEGLDYGINLNFNKNFFEQFKELILEVPTQSLMHSKNENCEYTNEGGSGKGCYLCFCYGRIENCLYSANIQQSALIIDSLGVVKSEIGYELVDCNFCYKVFYGDKSDYCKNSYYLYDCNNCENCIMCSGLKNKKYHILNKQYTKEGYKIRKEEILNNLEKYKKYYQELILKTPKKLFLGNNNENFSGDIGFNTKNCHHCFEVYNSENLKYCDYILYGQDSMDSSYFGYDLTKGYEGLQIGRSGYNLLFCRGVVDNTSDMIYCSYCVGCKNCFGCSGLKNKQYCILNKQYTKDEYEKLASKIIKHMQKTGEWGEFFSYDLSPFGYNETVANEYYPLEKEVALEKGFNWSDYEPPFPKVEKIIPAEKLPKNIKDIPDDILNRAIKCEITNKPYRIIKQELDFYRKFNLPIPNKHPDQRHKERVKRRNLRQIFNRNCQKCGKDIQTSYRLDSPKIIYCEECYNKEFY
ncbi:MAG: hypothetical protein N4A38_00475 [Candidatus Gracilibacteria bacterium]|nr:hypothetical protein [Candidatus Gracilibacteria bacterium]